jgi:hypothetical protein
LCQRESGRRPADWELPRFAQCPDLRCSAGLQPGTCRSKGQRYGKIRQPLPSRSLAFS